MSIPLASLVALVLTVATGGGVAAAHSTSTNASSFKYVALGDSYSAGEGVDPYFRDGPDPSTGEPGLFDNRCHRSSQAYSTWVKRPDDTKTLYALASGGEKPGSSGGKNKYASDKNVRSSGGVEWAFWACSGARTWNVLPAAAGGRPQGGGGQYWDSKTQLDNADLEGADLVTITIGGNDVGFVDALVQCAKSACSTPSFKSDHLKLIDDTENDLVKDYTAIKARAPGARVLVLGYPQLFPSRAVDQGCAFLVPWRGEMAMFREFGKHLNATIAAAAKTAGVKFVPVAGRFDGHEVCGSDGAWLNPYHFTPKGARKTASDESFHPTRTGQQDGYAAAVNAALQTVAPPKPVASDLAINVSFGKGGLVNVAGVQVNSLGGQLARFGSHLQLAKALGKWSWCGQGAEGSGVWASWSNGLSVNLRGLAGDGCGQENAVTVVSLRGTRAERWVVRTDLGTLRIGMSVSAIPERLRAAVRDGQSDYMAWYSSDRCVNRSLSGKPRMNAYVQNDRITDLNIYPGSLEADAGTC